MCRFRFIVRRVRSHKHLVGFFPEAVLLNDPCGIAELRQLVGGLVGPEFVIEFADLQKLFGKRASARGFGMHNGDTGLARRLCFRNGGREYG